MGRYYNIRLSVIYPDVSIYSIHWQPPCRTNRSITGHHKFISTTAPFHNCVTWKPCYIPRKAQTKRWKYRESSRKEDKKSDWGTDKERKTKERGETQDGGLAIWKNKRGAFVWLVWLYLVTFILLLSLGGLLGYVHQAVYFVVYFEKKWQTGMGEEETGSCI